MTETAVRDLPVRALRTCGIVAVVIVAVMATTGAVPGVLAQDPGEPVNIYGGAADEAGNPIPAGTTINAVVDGEVADSLTVEEAGTFGGPGAFDASLAVNTGAGDAVTFTVGGATGPTALETVDLDEESGAVEVNLTFPGETFADPVELAGLSLSVADTEVTAGDTTAAAVTALFEDGNQSDVTDVATLESLNPDVATVSGTTVVGESAGTATVQATYTVGETTETDTAAVTVEADPAPLVNISLALGETNLTEGVVTDATVTAAFSDGSEADVTETAVLDSLDPGVVTVTNGTVAGESAGTATVQATYTNGNLSVTDTVTVTVEAGSAELVGTALDLVTPSVPAGETTAVTVTATFSDGTEADVTDMAAVESLDPGVATVEGTTVTAASPGTATIQAVFTDDGLTETDTAELAVEGPVELVGISLSLAETAIETGGTTAATVTATFSNDSTVDVTGGAVVESLDPGVTAVDGNTVTGESAGTATVTAEFRGESDSAELAVEAAGEPLFEVTAVDAPAIAAPGESLTAVATITNAGDASGTVTVTYTFHDTEEQMTLDLGAGGTETITFSAEAPDETGDIEHTVTTPANSLTATTAVESDDPDDGGSGNGGDDGGSDNGSSDDGGSDDGGSGNDSDDGGADDGPRNGGDDGGADDGGSGNGGDDSGADDGGSGNGGDDGTGGDGGSGDGAADGDPGDGSDDGTQGDGGSDGAGDDTDDGAGDSPDNGTGNNTNSDDGFGSGFGVVVALCALLGLLVARYSAQTEP